MRVWVNMRKSRHQKSKHFSVNLLEIDLNSNVESKDKLMFFIDRSAYRAIKQRSKLLYQLLDSFLNISSFPIPNGKTLRVNILEPT